MAKKSKDVFVWTDDEVELLLKVTNDYKMEMAMENVHWETRQSKYSDIHDRFTEHYPHTEEAMLMGKDYPHGKEEITKVQVTTKLKAIRFHYRQAVSSGRKCGHGRVIMLFFELCELIWGESPATLSESTVTRNMVPEVSVLEQTIPGLSISCGERVKEVSVSAEMGNRHQRLDTTLTNHRRQKMRRKIPSDPDAQEDLEIKRRLLQQLETSDNEFVKTMGQWSSTMDRLNSNIEILVQRIMGSENFGYMPQLSQHTPLKEEYTCTPKGGPLWEYKPTAHGQHGSSPSLRCDVPEEAEDSEDEAAADLKIFKQHERNLRQQEKQQEQKRFEGLPTLTAAVTASSPLNFRLRSQAASSPSESLPVISDVMSLSTPKRLKRNLKSLTPNQAVKKVRTANACSSNTLNSPSTSTATPNVLSMVIPKNCDDDVIIVEINSTPKPKKLDFDLSKVKPERRTSDDVPGLHMECSDHASIETPVTEDTRTTTPTSTSSITQTESNIALKVEEDKQKQKEGKGEDRDNGPITMEQSGISVKRRIDKEMEINRLIEEPMEYMTCRSIDGENRPALTEDERMSSIPVKNYVFKSQERTDSGEKSSQRYPDSNANLDKGDKEGTSAASKSSNFHSLAHIPTTEAQQQQDNLMDLLDSTARERDEWREHAMLLSLKLEKQNIKLMELTVKREHSDQSAQTDPSDELDYKTLYLQATQQIEELRRERDGLKTNEEKMLQMKAEKEAHDKMCSDRMKAPGEGTSEIINAHESVDDEMALQLDFLLREMDQRNQLCGELKEKLESLEEERNGLLRQLKQIQKDMEQLRKETEEQRKTLGEQGTQTDFQCVNQVQVRQSSTQTSSTEDGTTSQASLVNQEDDASERREENSAIPAKLRELRVSVARLLVTFVPALDLEQVNYDCDVIDEILDQVLREISPPLTISN